MLDELRAADEQLYSRNGVLQMLERNASCKIAPERWQDERNRFFDVVVTYEGFAMFSVVFCLV
jgi:RNA polymerase II subunit A C-terminal domain phosphatase SSU72